MPTREEFKAKVKALPVPLRRLYLQFAKPAADLYRCMDDHPGCAGGTCTWVTICARPDRPWCPINQLLTEAWHPLQVMADSMEWFLLDGSMPTIYRDAYVQGDARLEAIK